MPTIDWTKPVRCKISKEPIRVLCTDAPGKCPVLLLGVRGDLTRATLDGCFYSGGVAYENVPPPKAVGEFTITMRRRASDGHVKVFAGRIDSTPVWKVIATKTVTITEGEGL